jgi:RHS repeat-associated protein
MTRQVSTLFACSDGNASLAFLLDAAGGARNASYEYSPFGETIQAAGAGAGDNLFRFAGQYQDDETGLVYFGQRYYHPGLGRWLSRDPLGDYGFRLTSSDWLDELGLAGERSFFGGAEHVFLNNQPVGQTEVLGLASSCDQQVFRALNSRRNRKLLERISDDGCPPPRVVGADAGTYCSLPGFLGDYDCASKQGLICCRNFERPSELEWTVHHELIHAVDCCEHRLATCEDHICSEIVAYYEADCAWFANPRECALGQMRSSLAGDEACAAKVAAADDQTVRACLKLWKERMRNR